MPSRYGSEIKVKSRSVCQEKFVLQKNDPMNTPIIEVKELSKSYGPVKALDEVSFEVQEGELFGFIGPDGSGKTTLFRILATLIFPDHGSARIKSFDVIKEYKKIRNTIGYMPGRFSLYRDLSVEENLKFFATIYGTTIEENYSRIHDIYSHIEPYKHRPAGKLSGGMKQKLALSCALIHNPDILILDEPTTGVDAVSRKEFWEMLKRLKTAGITILVSTPYMDEASLCDRVALMQKGLILRINTPTTLMDSFHKALYSIRSEGIYKLLNDLGKYENMGSIQPFGQTVHFIPIRSEIEPSGLYTFLREQGHSHVIIEQIRATIEDVFMMLMTEKSNL
jgi:ABC-2 type transport system ATP-binding protein